MGERPLVRWTVGNTNALGMRCLKRAIRAWRHLYGQRFDMMVCHNNMTPGQMAELRKLDVELVNQHAFANRLPLRPPAGRNPCWKLYPPRLRPGSHEIVIDNDVLLHRPLPAVEELLSNNQLFVTEAVLRSYGQFDPVVPNGLNVNTGMYGLPPGFDLEGKVTEVLKRGIIQQWKGHLDEQGLLALVFATERAKIVRLADISVLHPSVPYAMGKCGVHFVGLNGGYKERWLAYLLLTTI